MSHKLCEGNNKKKKKQCLVQSGDLVAILVSLSFLERYYYILIFIVNSSFEHKLRALHSLFYYSRLVPLYYKLFHIMYSCVINSIGAWCLRDLFIYFLFQVMFKFYSHID